MLALRRCVEAMPAAALVADNSSRYVAANSLASALTGYSVAELTGLSVMDLTPLPNSAIGRKLWEEFIAHGGQRGDYDLRRKNGSVVHVRYWAYASVAPGLHLSLLLPTER